MVFRDEELAGAWRPPGVRALVLAAGRGERLRPLTEELPKPLLPVAGRPLAAWTLERLRRAGVEAAALNLHHRGERIRSTFGSSFARPAARLLGGSGAAWAPAAPCRRSPTSSPRPTSSSWSTATASAAGRCAACSSGTRASAAAAPTPRCSSSARSTRGRFGGGVALERGRVVAFRSGALAWGAARTKRVFAGAAALEPELARAPARRGPPDIVSALYEPLLAAGEPIVAVETTRAWHDLGTPARYLEAALAWALERLPARGARILPEAAVDPSAELSRAVVEVGATVGAGARLRDALVLPAARVGAGASLAATILGPGAEVAAGERLERVLRVRGAADRAIEP